MSDSFSNRFTAIEDQASKRDGLAGLWEIAIKLQELDYLQVSDYALELRNRCIGNEIDIRECVEQMERHYALGDGTFDGSEKAEADVVAARTVLAIAEAASIEPSAETLARFHADLFSGLSDNAGQFRNGAVDDIPPASWYEADGRASEESPACLDAESIRAKVSEVLGAAKAAVSEIADGKKKRVAKIIEKASGELVALRPFDHGSARTVTAMSVAWLMSLVASEGLFS